MLRVRLCAAHMCGFGLKVRVCLAEIGKKVILK